MRILFFLRHTRDQASSRVRGFNISRELERNALNRTQICVYGRRRVLNLLLILLRYDVIYFQKRYSSIDIKLNKIVRRMGKKTIFDIDDSPGGTDFNREMEQRAVLMMRNSSAVVVGSHNLKEFAQKYNKNVYVVPSSVDLNYYKSKYDKKKKDCITLGWIGNGKVYKAYIPHF